MYLLSTDYLSNDLDLLTNYNNNNNTIKNIPILMLSKNLRFGSNLDKMKLKIDLNNTKTYYKLINSLGVCFN